MSLKKKFQLVNEPAGDPLEDFPETDEVPKSFQEAGSLAQTSNNKQRDVRPLTHQVMSFKGDWNARMVCGVLATVEMRRPCQHEYNLDLCLAVMKRFGQLDFLTKYPAQVQFAKGLFDEALVIHISKLKNKGFNENQIWSQVREFSVGVMPLNTVDMLVKLKGTFGHHVKDLTCKK